MKIPVSELIVNYMERLGIECIFGMPGAHILPVYDSLYHSSVKRVLARHDQDGIRQFQFEQTGPGDMRLKLCARQEVVDRVGQVVKSRLQTDPGSDMNLQMERIALIPRSCAGKHRSVIGLPVERRILCASRIICWNGVSPRVGV